MSKVLITVGDAAEAMDTLYPVYRVQEDGFEVVIAGPEARIYPLVMHEIPPGWDITRESPQLPSGSKHRLPRREAGGIHRHLPHRWTRP